MHQKAMWGPTSKGRRGKGKDGGRGRGNGCAVVKNSLQYALAYAFNDCSMVFF